MLFVTNNNNHGHNKMYFMAYMVPPYMAFTQFTCMPPPPLPQPTHSHTHACMQRPPAPADRLKQCQVCQEKLGAAPRVVSLPCGHDFCEACITTWLQAGATCPVCRYGWHASRCGPKRAGARRGAACKQVLVLGARLRHSMAPGIQAPHGAR